jgi:DNA polymerase III subunit gamma/tau
MSQALYRTYRPQSFKDVVGQNPIRITLENEVEHGRIAHAYLFAGPRGVGKTTTARLLAKAVNCSKRKGAEPCNACDSCREISTGRSMDLIEIDAASHTGVDNVRENIIENARFTPQRAKYKVFIIDEVHMLSVSAFNALLKTLEEPPEHVIFILATTEIHRLPETIISRCQRFDFKRVNTDDLIKRLHIIAKAEKITVPEEILATMARRAEGSVRDAEVLLAQIMALGEKNITEETASLIIPRSNINLIFELFGYLVHNNASAAIVIINKLIDEGVNIQDFSRELIEFLRKVLLFKLGGPLNEIANLILDKKMTEILQQQLEVITVDRLVTMIEVISIKTREMKYSSIMQLPLELAVLELQQKPASRDHIEPVSSKTDSSTDQPITTQKEKPMITKNKSNKAISLETLKNDWVKIIKELQKNNQSLALSLKVGSPTALDETTLTIGFRYNFHAERVKDRKVKSVIEEAIEKIMGKKLALRTSIISQEEFEQITKEMNVAPNEESAVQNVLRAFGGEVVPEE